MADCLTSQGGLNIRKPSLLGSMGPFIQCLAHTQPVLTVVSDLHSYDCLQAYALLIMSGEGGGQNTSSSLWWLKKQHKQRQSSGFLAPSLRFFPEFLATPSHVFLFLGPGSILQRAARLLWSPFGKSSERTRACSLGLLARSYVESFFRVREWVPAPVLLTVMALSLGPAWLLASIVLSPREPVMLSQAHCVLGGLPGACSTQGCGTSPLSWNSRSKNHTSSWFTPQLFLASFCELPLWHCFLRSKLWCNETAENPNTVHGMFIKKTIVEKDSATLPHKISVWEGDENDHREGRVSSAMLNDCIRAGVTIS